MKIISRIVTGIVTNTWQGATGPLRALIQHRTLLAVLVKRDLIHRTSGTMLGALWPIIQPALQILGFWFLFELVLQVRYAGKVSYLDYLLIGMLPWLCIMEILSRSTGMFIEFSALYKRNPFPLVILPLIILCIPCIAYTAVYFVASLLLYDITVAIQSLIVIPLICLWLIPFCYLLSVMGVFFKDVGQAIPFLLTLFMYITPILYMPQQLPESVKDLMMLNPFADIMAMIHFLIQDQEANLNNLLRPLYLWLLMVGPAWLLFKRSAPHVREIV